MPQAAARAQAAPAEAAASVSARAKAGWILLTAAVGCATMLAGWSLSQTYVLGCEQARQKQAVEDLAADVKEIKGDVKQLLKRGQ